VPTVETMKSTRVVKLAIYLAVSVMGLTWVVFNAVLIVVAGRVSVLDSVILLVLALTGLLLWRAWRLRPTGPEALLGGLLGLVVGGTVVLVAAVLVATINLDGA